MDTGAPKTVCSEQWLQQANWTPLRKVSLPGDFSPFRFAGHPVRAVYGALLAATITDIKRIKKRLCLFAFVLPSTPIPPLLGLQDQRRLGFDICLQKGHASHLKITHWNSIHPLTITSHLWLSFKADNSTDPASPEFSDIVYLALLHHKLLHTSYNFNVTTSATVPQQSTEDDNEHKAYIVPPWLRDDRKSNIQPETVGRIHQALKHPEKSALVKFSRKFNGNQPTNYDVIKSITDPQCQECDQTQTLPRTPKLALPPESVPNVAVSLDVLSHKINNKTHEILVILDHGDMFLLCALITDLYATTAFQAYYTHWISYYYSPIFTVVDRGSNLAAAEMQRQLHKIQSQLCPIPTESPWSLGANECSHQYIHKAITRLLLQLSYQPGENLSILLSDISISWNLTLHVNNILPFYHRFGMMPRILGELYNPSRLSERQHLMLLAREVTAQSRAQHVIRRILHHHKRNLTTLRHFEINQRVWFYRRRHGWHEGIVSRMDPPTIFMSFKNDIYPTHEARVSPHFGELSLPPDLLDQREDLLDTLYKPKSLQLDNTDISSRNTPSNSSTKHQNFSGRAPISELQNGVFIHTSTVEEPFHSLRVPVLEFTLLLPSPQTSMIYSNGTFVTTQQIVKSIDILPESDRTAFQSAIKDKIEFLLQHFVRPIPLTTAKTDAQLQIFRWIFSIKRSTNASKPDLHRARLVSASHRPSLRHKVHENSPTVSITTIRILLGILRTWFELEPPDDSLVVFFRDVTKSFIQSLDSQRYII